MAIYHVSVSVGSIGKGASATSKDDYLEREGKYQEDEGLPEPARELAHVEHGNLPEWAETGRAYWQAVDAGERSNGTLYRQVEFALPVELEEEERIQAAREFARELSNSAGERLPYTLAVHRGEGTNPHAHLILSERVNDGLARTRETWCKRANGKHPDRGGARKTRRLQGKRWLIQTRQDWARIANRRLARAGRPERIDHRSLVAQRAAAVERGDGAAARALDREPGRHRGPHWLDSAIRRRMRVVESLTGDAGRLARQIRMLAENLEHRRRYRALAEGGPGQEVRPDPTTRRVEYSNRGRTAQIEPSRTSGGYQVVMRERGEFRGKRRVEAAEAAHEEARKYVNRGWTPPPAAEARVAALGRKPAARKRARKPRRPGAPAEYTGPRGRHAEIRPEEDPWTGRKVYALRLERAGVTIRARVTSISAARRAAAAFADEGQEPLPSGSGEGWSKTYSGPVGRRAEVTVYPAPKGRLYRVTAFEDGRQGGARIYTTAEEASAGAEGFVKTGKIPPPERGGRPGAWTKTYSGPEGRRAVVAARGGATSQRYEVTTYQGEARLGSEIHDDVGDAHHQASEYIETGQRPDYPGSAAEPPEKGPARTRSRDWGWSR